MSGANPCPYVVVGVDPTIVTSATSTLKNALSHNLQGPKQHLQFYGQSLVVTVIYFYECECNIL